MQNKLLLILGLSITLLLSWPMICLAEDGLVHLKAEHVEYNYDGEIVSATDQVVITYKDLTISAERAFIAINDNQLEADGNIEIQRGEERYYGDHLSYDLKTEQGFLEPVNIEVNGEDIKGTIFGQGKQGEIHGENSKVYYGSLTTCDLENPHYHLTAKEIDYYPNDRLIFHHAFYYEGKVPILYWPYLCISLKDKDNNFLTPVVGHDQTMGWFLILGYRYYFNENWKGIAYFDWMSILGRRYRFQQDYHWGERDSLTTEVAWLDNKVTGNNELSSTLKYDTYFGKDWNFVLDAKWAQETDYQTVNGWSVPTHDLINDIYIQGEIKKESGNPYLRVNYSDTESSRYFTLAPSISWQPFRGGTLNLYGNWSNVTYKTTEEDEDLKTYGLTLLYDQSISDHLKLSLNHQFTSNGRSVTDLLTFTGPQWDLGWFPQTQFTSDLTYKSIPEQDGYKWGL
ncbi:MAG TPA: LptA/OstA family protein, partial [Bacillota bacterium]|nr:LptA/OstA family protein [Bacillota bacterium]